MDILEEFLYQESVDQDDFDLAMAVETAELAVDRILLSCNMICEKANLDLREAELKCVQESGNANDLIRLYEEAKEASSEQKKNIFARAWEAIKNLWRRIVAFFKGEKVTAKVNGIKDTDEFTAPKGLMNKIKTGLKWLTDHISNGASKLWKLIKDRRAANVGAAVSLVIGLCRILNLGKIKEAVKEAKENPANGEKVSGKDVVAVLKSIFDFSSSVESAIDTASKNGGEDQETTNKVIAVLKAIGTAIGKLPELIFGLPKRVFGKNKGDGEPLGLPDKSGEPRNGFTQSLKGTTNDAPNGFQIQGEKNENFDHLTKSVGKLEKNDPAGSTIKMLARKPESEERNRLVQAIRSASKANSNNKKKLQREILSLLKGSHVTNSVTWSFEMAFTDGEIAGFDVYFEDGEHMFVDINGNIDGYYTEEEEDENVDINDIFNEAFGEGGLDPEEDVATEAVDDIDSLLDELFNEYVEEESGD